MIATPARLVHLAPAPVGRADPRLLLQGLRRARSCTPELRAPRGRRLRDGERRRLVRARGGGAAARGLRAARSAGARSSTKEKDILDVWFDSGSSHAAVLGAAAGPALAGRRLPRGQRPAPRLVPLVAADRRGARAARRPTGRSSPTASPSTPQGRKISKSLGNDVDTQKLIADLRAEILRLWTIMVDYREDMRVLRRDAAAGGRGLPQGPQHLPLPALEPVRLRPRPGRGARGGAGGDRPLRAGPPPPGRGRACSRPTTTYEFHVVYHQLVQYCAVDLSSFYLDVLKDRLYCDAAGRAAPPLRADRAAPHRRGPRRADGAGPALHRGRGVGAHPGQPGESVHLALFPDAEPADEDRSAAGSALLEVRAAVMKALEEARAAKRIAASLEARVELRGARRRARPAARATRRRAACSPATWPTCSS